MTASVLDINLQKSDLRKLAFSKRKSARAAVDESVAQAHLSKHVQSLIQTGIVAAYMPIQTEIDPRPTMTELHDAGFKICLPVIQGHAMPLLFREWTPDCAMIEGDFGALIPRGGAEVCPDLAIIPLVAFNLAGHRLGYGGGFYDRTLIRLVDNPGFKSVGFAYSDQKMDGIPTDKFDQKLDFIVTEKGVHAT